MSTPETVTLTIDGVSVEVPRGTGLVEAALASRNASLNRRELAACLGLNPSPYDSGGSQREQGISKAGNRRARALLVEISWYWLRYQPHSALTEWFNQRFAAGGKRARRIGIVALARRLAGCFDRRTNP